MFTGARSTRAIRASILVVLALALLFGLRALPSAAAEGDAAVTVVRELTGRRTAYGTTYLLSNGQFRTVISHDPLHFKDAAGDWQPVDTTLVEVGDGVYEIAASAVTVTVRDEAAGSPAVTVASVSAAVALNLVGATEDGLTVAGSAATYPGVATATDLSYTATGDGLKETITLASGAAPNSFPYRLNHPGHFSTPPGRARRRRSRSLVRRRGRPTVRDRRLLVRYEAPTCMRRSSASLAAGFASDDPGRRHCETSSKPQRKTMRRAETAAPAASGARVAADGAG